MQIIQFKAEHAKMIKIQPMQAQDAERLKQIDLSPFEKMQSFTVINDNGEIVLICGIVPLWSGRVCLWSFFAEHSGKYFISLVRLIKLYMDSIEATRIE